MVKTEQNDICKLVFRGNYQKVAKVKVFRNIFFPGTLDSFYATGLFLYPLKTLENQKFSDVLRGYKRPVV